MVPSSLAAPATFRSIVFMLRTMQKHQRIPSSAMRQLDLPLLKESSWQLFKLGCEKAKEDVKTQ